MAITASSQTALDVPSLVSQLMGVERLPVDKIAATIKNTEIKISALGTVKSLISSFQAASSGLNSSLQSLTTTPSNASVLSATARSNAVPGSYTLSVSQLAQSQNVVAAGQTSSTAAIGDGSATTVTFDIGAISGGTLNNGIYSGATFTSNGSGTVSLTIDSSNNSLEGIRDAINAAAPGVTATIVNDGSGTPYRLALSSSSSGASNSFKITTSGGDGTIGNLLGYDPAGTQNLTQTVAAQDANLSVNGISITSASNTVNEAIQGVTLSLKSITATPTNLTVARDTAAINTAASTFVEAYSALASQIQSRSTYGADGKGAGTLAGDGALRQMQEQLRGIFMTPASGGTLSRMSEVGISLQVDGSLRLDSGKLSAAMSTNFSDVSNLFTSSTGFTTRLTDWAKSTLAPEGLIEVRNQSLNKFVKDQNAAIEKLESRLSVIERQYTTEYTNLNLLLSRMNSLSTYLTNQFSNNKNG